LKKANCFGLTTWQEALNAANTLAAPACGLTDKSKAGDWRLPNVNELLSLIDYGFLNPALSNAAGNSPWTEGDAFSDVQSTVYWSSTSVVGFSFAAWFISLGNGSVNGAVKSDNYYVWPVRGRK